MSKKGKADAEVAKFFSRKMTWLSEMCRDPFVTDGQFRVAYSLVVTWLHNESDWCKPTDEKLGNSCGKSGRTIRRLTAELQDAGHIDKQKQLGPSQYVFTGLTDGENISTPANLGQCSVSRDISTPANLGIKTGRVGYEDRPPVGRTEPSNLPSDLPTDYLVSFKKEKEAFRKEEVAAGSENQNLLSERSARQRVARYISAEPLVRDYPPSPQAFEDAVKAELLEVGAGREIVRKAANDTWKAKRSA